MGGARPSRGRCRGGGLAPQVVHRNVVGLACGPGRDRGDDADCRVEQRHRHPCIWALALDGDGYDWRNPDVIIAGLPKAGAATSAISWRAGASPEALVALLADAIGIEGI